MALTKEKRGRYVDGFQALSDMFEPITLPVKSGVAISRGDCLIITSGYAALATTLAVASAADFYVALSTNTAAEASSDGAVNVTCIPVSWPVRFMVPVAANAVLAQATHVGNAYNLDGSEDAITVASAVTTDTGFLIEEIDISDEAIAANTYGYAIGRFVIFSETT